MMPPLLVLVHHLGLARLIALLLDGEEYESFPIFNWESDENLEETMEPKKKKKKIFDRKSNGISKRSKSLKRTLISKL